MTAIVVLQAVVMCCVTHASCTVLTQPVASQLAQACFDCFVVSGSFLYVSSTNDACTLISVLSVFVGSWYVHCSRTQGTVLAGQRGSGMFQVWAMFSL